jgi:hypothetical protein
VQFLGEKAPDEESGWFLSAVWFWASSLTSLGLGFAISKKDSTLSATQAGPVGKMVMDHTVVHRLCDEDSSSVRHRE